MLALPVTAMALPRLWQGDMLDAARVGTTYCCMTLVCAMFTAWQRYATIEWLSSKRSQTVVSLVVALLLGVAAWWPAMYIEANLRSVLLPHENAALWIPHDIGDVIIILLWSAGPETIMFSAGAMCFFARLSAAPLFSAGAAAFLRCWIVLLQFEAVGLGAPSDEQLVFVGLRTFCGCVLFGVGGLPAAIAFAAIGELHHFFHLAH